MNKKISTVLSIFFSLMLISLGLNLMPSKTLAQIEGDDSEEFVEPESPETEEERELLENEQFPESREEREEQELVHPILRDSDSPSLDIEERPAPGVGDNMPTQPPLGETELQIR